MKHYYKEVKEVMRGEKTPEDFVMDVQYCKKRGRINGIFQCYTGELSCYEPVEEE